MPACLLAMFKTYGDRLRSCLYLSPVGIPNSGLRDFRPISLTSFLLKTVGRLVDKYLRDEALAQVPLHPNQHAYQAGKWV
jgi:hypothetical protein